MSKLAIKGHKTRGKEVIQLLEMLGGSNSNHCTGQFINRIYFINKYGYIESTDDIKLQLYYATHNLEEFLEKLPYKVGDKVCFPDDLSTPFTINKMWWDENANELLCSFIEDDIEVPVVGIRTYKEKSIDKTNKVIFDNQAQSCDIMNYIIKKDMEEMDIIKPTTEINLNHPCFDEHNEIELIIPNGWKFEQRGNKMFGIRTQYPKTYEECCRIIDYHLTGATIIGYEKPLLGDLQQLLICRDAYWKIAGEEMGLGKPWKKDYDNRCFIIANNNGNIHTYEYHGTNNVILAFPTPEMRDAFFENFKGLIEQCKELL